MSDDYWTPSPKPCGCIVGPVALHSGHCCITAMPDDWRPGDGMPCHGAEWQAQIRRETLTRQEMT